MKSINIISIIVLGMSLNFLTACNNTGNTGNGATDTPIKQGSGYSDSTNPEKGEFDRTQTPDETKRNEDQNRR